MEAKKILIVAPPFIPVSEDSVAGIEQMTYVLGKALTEQGHNVTTIAREDSQVYGSLIPGGLKDIQAQTGAELEHFHQAMSYTSSATRQFIRSNKNPNVIIDRCQGISLTVSHEENGPPVICSLDMPPKYHLARPYFNSLRRKLEERKDCFAAVSSHTAQSHIEHFSLGDLQSRMHAIHNGIETNNFPLEQSPEDYLLYLGRIRKGKSPHLAIKAAKETHQRIIIAGGNIPRNNDGQYEDKQYFNRKIAPHLGSSVEWFGPANLEQKVKLMQKAKALLFTSQEEEAFGLVPVEAMACGTPVIAFKQSKGPKETIKHEETGFLVSTYEELIESMGKLDGIDRKKCSDHVKKHFDYKKMGKDFEKLIYSITENER